MLMVHVFLMFGWLLLIFFKNRLFSDTVNSQFPSNAFTFGTQINFPVSFLFIHLTLTRPSLLVKNNSNI